MELKSGDVFCTTSNHWLSKSIRSVSKFWSTDGQVKYSHGGIILDSDGTTIEALNSGVKKQNFFEAYKGCPVLVARPMTTTPHALECALKCIVLEHLGKAYPWWRIGMHIFGPLSKIGATDYLVCTELQAKYLWLAGLSEPQYRGKTPDTMADRFINWKCFDVIAETIL